MKHLFLFWVRKGWRSFSGIAVIFAIVSVGFPPGRHLALASDGHANPLFPEAVDTLFQPLSADTPVTLPSDNSQYLFSNDPKQQYFAQLAGAEEETLFENRKDRKAPDAMDVPETETERWSSFLPLMGGKAIERGYKLPLPFGVNLATMMMKRDVDVSYLGVGVDGPPQSVNDFVEISTSNSINANTLRFDAWLLPFMNIYAIAGYTESECALSVSLSAPGLLPDEIEVVIPNPIPGREDWVVVVPRPGLLPDEISFNTKTNVGGGSFGGGLTFAGGYKSFFATLDSNFTTTKMEGAGGAVEQAVEAYITTARGGWNGSVGNTNTVLWLGIQYWKTDRTIEGSIWVPDVGNINYKVDVEPTNPYNMTVGGRIELDKRFWLVTEYGDNFHDMTSLMVNVIYRF